jgi:hypothetical protein
MILGTSKNSGNRSKMKKLKEEEEGVERRYSIE